MVKNIFSTSVYKVLKSDSHVFYVVGGHDQLSNEYKDSSNLLLKRVI